MQGGDGAGLAGRFLASPRYLAAFQPKKVPHFFTDILIIEWGAKFDQNGRRLALTREGGHRHNRIVHAHGDATGREIGHPKKPRSSTTGFWPCLWKTRG